jgi:hypothetical protein
MKMPHDSPSPSPDRYCPKCTTEPAKGEWLCQECGWFKGFDIDLYPDWIRIKVPRIRHIRVRASYVREEYEGGPCGHGFPWLSCSHCKPSTTPLTDDGGYP